eukprot:768691-Hanusia_phi.AAC.2
MCLTHGSAAFTSHTQTPPSAAPVTRSEPEHGEKLQHSTQPACARRTLTHLPSLTRQTLTVSSVEPLHKTRPDELKLQAKSAPPLARVREELGMDFEGGDRAGEEKEGDGGGGGRRKEGKEERREQKEGGGGRKAGKKEKEGRRRGSRRGGSKGRREREQKEREEGGRRANENEGEEGSRAGVGSWATPAASDGTPVAFQQDAVLAVAFLRLLPQDLLDVPQPQRLVGRAASKQRAERVERTAGDPARVTPQAVGPAVAEAPQHEGEVERARAEDVVLRRERAAGHAAAVNLEGGTLFGHGGRKRSSAQRAGAVVKEAGMFKLFASPS